DPAIHGGRGPALWENFGRAGGNGGRRTGPDGAVCNGGHDEHRSRAEERRRVDEGHWRIGAGGAPYFSGGSGAAGAGGGIVGRGGRDFAFGGFGQSGVWRGGRAAAGRVSCFGGADGDGGDTGGVSAAAAGEPSADGGFSRRRVSGQPQVSESA